MSTLVFLEHHDGELLKPSLGVLSKAAELGGDVAGVVLGSGVTDLAAKAGAFGAAKVHVADQPELEQPLPQPRVDALAKLIGDQGYGTVLFAASVLAADVAAGLSARLGAGLNWDLTDLVQQEGNLVGKRPALGDSVYVDVGWSGEPRLALVRAGTFEPKEGSGDAEVEQFDVDFEDFSLAATMLEQAHAESEGPSIEEADVIVAGGRGLGAPENFKLVEELAQALGGAVAATRAVVDSGWYPYAAQVGQTGKTVSPKLYIACGISGAIQHKVGMQSSGLIVAINKDANAPIFEFCDFGVVGDLNEVVPKLTELVPVPQELKPADTPPPFDPRAYVTAPTDAPEERIDVGVLIVGAGPAGLACAIRLGQLLEENPEAAERLGEVPIAVLEKGKSVGSHLVSGAVVNPRGFRRLFRGRDVGIEDMPNFGPVEHESVYFLTPSSAMRIPTPPTMKNDGNFIASLAQLSRWLAEQAEAGGAMILPETAAEKLLVTGARTVGVRTGDKGRGKDGEPLPNFEPGADVTAKVTVLAEGTQGHLTGVALDHLGLRGENPQVWALGVKEVWKVAKPLDRIIHTMGWPLRGGKKYREFGGSFIYPMGEDMITIGLVVGLDYRDAEISVHDLLQELKTHRFVRKLLEGGERVGWGAKTIPEGGFVALPQRLHAPGLLLAGDGAGFVNVPALKGIHYAVETGRLAAEAAFAALQPGRTPWTPGALASYDESIRRTYVWEDLKRVRNMRQEFTHGFVLGGAMATAATVSFGKFPPGNKSTEADAETELFRTKRASKYPDPDGKLTFDKLSSVYLSGNKTRDDAPNHIRVRTDVPKEIGAMWERMCPAQVYEVKEDGGETTVEVTASNCVQCGAITAKGGRLTPPEGGSGPEYTLT